MIVEIYNPETNEFCQSLDMNDYQCYGISGRLPINEACGGCVGCLLAQAEYWGYKIVYLENDK